MKKKILWEKLAPNYEHRRIELWANPIRRATYQGTGDDRIGAPTRSSTKVACPSPHLGAKVLEYEAANHFGSRSHLTCEATR